MKRKVTSHHDGDLPLAGTDSHRQEAGLLRKAIHSLTYPFYLIDAETYRVILDNSTPELQPSADDVKCHTLMHNNPQPCSRNGESCPLEIIKETRQPAVVKHVHYDSEGKPRHFEVRGYPVFNSDGEVASIIEYSLDITDREVAQQRQQFATRLLDLLNQSTDKTDTIREILFLVKEFTGFEAIGIRLREGDDFPYYETIGFPATFVEKENFLCIKDHEGRVVRRDNNEPLLECMCGNVIQGRTDPTQPFFTRGGSFWSNCTTDLLASTTEDERQSHTRNVCNARGYESVALIPLRSDSETIGLLQLNDTRKDRFTLDMIEFFEAIGASVGIALVHRQAQEALQIAHDQLELRVKERTVELEAANAKLREEIAERKRTARALMVLSECNKTLVRATTEDELLRGVCAVIVSSGHYRLAWVGYAEDDPGKSVQPICQAGFEEGYLQTLDISWDDVERGRGPTGTAIRTGQPCISRDILADPKFEPWRSEASRRGYASSLALPLRSSDAVIGALNIYAAESNAFDDDEVRLLMELADDLAFGVMSLRSAAARRVMERALADSEERYRELVEGTDNLVCQVDTHGQIMFINSAAEQTYGVSPDACVGMSCFDFVHPDDRARTREAFDSWVRSRTGKAAFENRAIGRDGIVSYMLWTIELHYDRGGRLTYLNWIGRDFTERREAEEALHYRLQLEELIASLSTSFINLKADEIDAGIDRALKEIGQFDRVDRSYIFEFSDDGERMSNTHEWCEEGITPVIDALQDLDPRMFPWSMTRLRRFKVVHVPRVGELPEEATPERQTFEEQAIKSLILVPMVYGGSLLGFVGFDSVKQQRVWSDDTVSLLRIVGDMFVNTLVRGRNEMELRKVNEELNADRGELQNKNIALRELLSQVEEDRKSIRKQITTNVEESLTPLLARLKEQCDESQRDLIDVLEKSLKDVASPFIDTLKSKFSRLTPRELEICQMIKAGRASKDIARVHNVSLLTVHKHREQIRRKLGLKNSNVNLNSFLQSFETEK